MDRTVTARNLSELGQVRFQPTAGGIGDFMHGGLIYHTLAPHGLVGPSLAHLWVSHPIFTLLVLAGVIAMVSDNPLASALQAPRI